MANDTLEQLTEQTAVGEETDTRLPVGLTLLAASVAVLVVLPLVWLLDRASMVGVERAVALLTSADNIAVLVNSVGLVAAVTLGGVLLGVPLAVLTVQTDLPFRRFWTIASALPLVVPSYIGAFSYVSAFGPRGELADLLAPLGVERIPSIYGFHGAALVLILYTYPYVFLTTRAALLSFDATLVEAARTLNHTRWQAFRRITLPQITPGITAGALLVALYTLSDFGTPAIMQFEVFTQQIYVNYRAFGGRDLAALFSLQLVAVTLVILAVESRIGASQRGAYVSRGARRPGEIELGKWKAPALLFAATVTTLCLVVPLAVLVLWLTWENPGYGAGALAFSWEYGWNSVLVSAAAAIVCILGALPVAYLSARSESWLATIIDRATYVGYAAPGVVVGFSLLYFGVTYAPILYQTIVILVFAYVVRFLPQALGTARSSLLQVDPKLVEAARTLGHRPTTAFRKVVLPLIMPGVAAGAALVFLTTMKELPATLMLRPTGFDTFVTYIWRVRGSGHYGKAAFPALVLVVISGLSMLVILARERYDVG